MVNMNIYHRIFKLYQRKIPVQQIAATTHMPLKSVKEIIRKFNADKQITKIEEVEETEQYLDVHITKHRKYTLVDYSGFFIEDFSDVINNAIIEIRQQLGSTLAIKMDEVVKVDSSSMQRLVDYHKELHKIGKSLVLLSPSDSVESFIDEHNIEATMKIFGTISAFEEHAFNSAHR